MGKTLIINGSPRENGYSAAVTKYLAKRLDCTVIELSGENIAHCTGCDACVNGACFIDDKMREYYALIREAESIIFVSPLYFSMLTGLMLSFASRWQYFYRNRVGGQKKGAVILLGGGSTKDISKAYSTAKIIMRYVGITEPDCLSFIGTDREDPLENDDFLKKLKVQIKNILE